MTIVTRQDDGGIATVILDAPARLNALSDAMLAALTEVLQDIATSPAIKVVILAATGRAFCAGHDLREMQEASPEALTDLFDRCTALMTLMQDLPQPIIARVHGNAVAAGCQLVATCDMAVAADTALFGVNGVNIGLFCSTPMVALTRNIAPKAALEMLTTGRLISAAEAQQLGLINRAVAPDALEESTRALASQIAAKPGAALRLGKDAFYAQRHLSTAEAYALTGRVMVQNMADPDTAEGISAFLEKRPPDWS